MKIFITGGTGTIGGYVLRELLTCGHSITNYSRSKPIIDGIETIHGNIRDLHQLKSGCKNHDAIIHLAAVPGPGRATPEQLIHDNVIGTVNVLEAAVAANIPKVVFTSSGAVHGFTFQKKEIKPNYLPLDEEHPCEPEDEYGLSKLLAEITCKRYSKAFGIQTICLRLGNNWYLDRPGAEIAVRSGWGKSFGGNVEKLWLQRYCKTIEDDGSTDWPIPGPPPPLKVLWEVTDARDAAQAVRLAVEKDDILHDVFLTTGNETCSTLSTHDLITRFFPQIPLKKSLDGFASLWSNDKAARLLGYRPKYSWRHTDFSVWFNANRSTNPTQ